MGTHAQFIEIEVTTMKKIILITAINLLPSVATAQTPPKSQWGTTLPPPRFDVTPPMPVIEQILTKDETNKVCIEKNAGKHAPPGLIYWGCAQRQVKDGKLVCLVYRIDNERVRR